MYWDMQDERENYLHRRELPGPSAPRVAAGAFGAPVRQEVLPGVAAPMRMRAVYCGGVYLGDAPGWVRASDLSDEEFEKLLARIRGDRDPCVVAKRQKRGRA